MKIDNVMSRQIGEKKIEKLKKVTESNCNNFELLLCPVEDSFDILFQFDYEFDDNIERCKQRQQQISELFDFMLTDNYCKDL